jgi:hypothetical protein
MVEEAAEFLMSGFATADQLELVQKIGELPSPVR